MLGDAATVGVLTSAAKLEGTGQSGFLTARFFGTSDALDAFLIAFLLPSFLSGVVAGSFTPSLVPQLIRTQADGGTEEAKRPVPTRRSALHSPPCSRRRLVWGSQDGGCCLWRARVSPRKS